MAKKELISSGAPTGRSAFLDRLRKNFAGLTSASDGINASYLDVWNAKDDLPSIAQEYMVGGKGWLDGRICQYRATFSKGKSSMMYQQYGASQLRHGAYCFHVETEGAGSPPNWIASFGCNPEDLMMLESESLEKCFGFIDQMRCEFRGGNGVKDPIDPKNEHPLVFGVDSLSQLNVDSLAQQDVMDMTKASQPGVVAKKMREWFSANVQKLRASRTFLFLTSHETAKIATGPMAFGGPQKTAKAQEAIGVSGTYAYDLGVSKWTASNGDILGSVTNFKCFKNKWSGREFNGKVRSVDMYLHIGHGFDLCHTDAMFLSKNPNSPFAWHHELSKFGTPAKDAYGWKWPALSDKRFRTAEDLMRAFYANEDLLMKTREALQLYGFGFAFESGWRTRVAETEDNGSDGSRPEAAE